MSAEYPRNVFDRRLRGDRAAAKRTDPARIPIDKDELVLTLDDRDRLDIRAWTATSGVRMPSANGLIIALTDLPAPIEALPTITHPRHAPSTGRARL